MQRLSTTSLYISFAQCTAEYVPCPIFECKYDVQEIVQQPADLTKLSANLASAAVSFIHHKASALRIWSRKHKINSTSNAGSSRIIINLLAVRIELLHLLLCYYNAKYTRFLPIQVTTNHSSCTTPFNTSTLHNSLEKSSEMRVLEANSVTHW